MKFTEKENSKYDTIKKHGIFGAGLVYNNWS